VAAKTLDDRPQVLDGFPALLARRCAFPVVHDEHAVYSSSSRERQRVVMVSPGSAPHRSRSRA
jgi:hypothetical protein